MRTVIIKSALVQEKGWHRKTEKPFPDRVPPHFIDPWMWVSNRGSHRTIVTLETELVGGYWLHIYQRVFVLMDTKMLACLWKCGYFVDLIGIFCCVLRYSFFTHFIWNTNPYLSHAFNKSNGHISLFNGLTLRLPDKIAIKLRQNAKIFLRKARVSLVL